MQPLSIKPVINIKLGVVLRFRRNRRSSRMTQIESELEVIYIIDVNFNENNYQSTRSSLRRYLYNYK